MCCTCGVYMWVYITCHLIQCVSYFCVMHCHKAPIKGSVASFFASVKDSDKSKCETH